MMFQRLCLPFCLVASLSDAGGQNWYWSNPMPHGNTIIGLGYYAPGGHWH
jgi:hypothetical protein